MPFHSDSSSGQNNCRPHKPRLVDTYALHTLSHSPQADSSSAQNICRPHKPRLVEKQPKWQWDFQSCPKYLQTSGWFGFCGQSGFQSSGTPTLFTDGNWFCTPMHNLSTHTTPMYLVWVPILCERSFSTIFLY
jgi:hypothetical protein